MVLGIIMAIAWMPWQTDALVNRSQMLFRWAWMLWQTVDAVANRCSCNWTLFIVSGMDALANGCSGNWTLLWFSHGFPGRRMLW